MKVDAYMKSEGGNLETLRNFLARLLKEGIVEYLLVPQEISQGRTLTQTLVKEPVHLEKANPFSPVMAINSASLVSQLTADKPQRKLGAVLKPCEIRALIELVKLGQASIENLLIIGIDCLGTYEVEDYAKYIDNAKNKDKKKGIIRSDTELSIQLRTACQMCVELSHPQADITLSLFGIDDGVIINLEKEHVKKLGLKEKKIPGRQETIAEIVKRKKSVQDKVFAEFREKMKTINDFADALATCTRCYACQSACPICYCRICFFRTETFEPESERYFRWAEKEDALRMPPEILLFHLTRLNHMAASCVGCGMCESACSRNLPLTTIFKAVGDGVQKELEYEPGRSLEDEIPISAFEEAEK